MALTAKTPASRVPVSPPTPCIAEHVERVVVIEAVLEPGAGPEADPARNDADDDAVPWRDEAGRRRDGTEAGDGARNHVPSAPKACAASPIRSRPRSARRAQAARCVAVIAMTARELAANADPPLKPNQPTQSAESAPITASDRSNGEKVLAAITVAPAHHLARPVRRCRRKDARRGRRQNPVRPWWCVRNRRPTPTCQRHIDEHEPADREQQIGRKFIRSATEPATSATVMIANVIW